MHVYFKIVIPNFSSTNLPSSSSVVNMNNIQNYDRTYHGLEEMDGELSRLAVIYEEVSYLIMFTYRHQRTYRGRSFWSTFRKWWKFVIPLKFSTDIFAPLTFSMEIFAPLNPFFVPLISTKKNSHPLFSPKIFHIPYSHWIFSYPLFSSKFSHPLFPPKFSHPLFFTERLVSKIDPIEENPRFTARENSFDEIPVLWWNL